MSAPGHPAEPLKVIPSATAAARSTNAREPWWGFLGRRPQLVTGGVVTASVLAVYSIGAGRAWGLDASASVHNFIETPSLLDPFRRQIVYNNHVLFSFVDHLVYTITGSTDERVLRIVPIAASALAAAILAAAIARRLGALPGLVAGAVVASSPLLISTGRDARGYSMMLLACTISTVLLFQLRGSARERPATITGYVLALAAGVAAHLYGLAMIPVHAALVGRFDRPLLRRWVPRWAAGGAVGLTAYAGIASAMLNAHRHRHFQPDFPISMVKLTLGGNGVTIALLAIPLAVGLTVVRKRGWVWRGATAALMIVTVVWIIGPQDLYPRFFLWLLPAVAFLIASAVARFRALAALVVALVVVQTVRFAPTFAKSEIPNRIAANLAREVSAAGGSPCALGDLSAYAMEAYVPRIETVGFTRVPPHCDVIFAVYVPVPVDRVKLPASWLIAFPYRRVLPAASPGLALSRRPLTFLRPPEGG